jgi:U3 small nucleolar RNA-associated protein 19
MFVFNEKSADKQSQTSLSKKTLSFFAGSMAPTLRSLPPPSKKRKLQPGSGCVQKIKELEDELIKAVTTRASLNCLVNLLDLTFQAEDPHDTSKGIYALYRTFVVIITHGKLSPQGGEAGRTVSRWLWERLNSYAEFLASLLKDEEKFLRVSSCGLNSPGILEHIPC